MQQNWDYFWQRQKKVKTSWSKKRILTILENYVEPKMTVLDAGCGSGFFSNYFINKGCKVYSLDNSNEALNITKKNTHMKSQYLKRDLLDEKLKDEFRHNFDIIFTDGLFEHFTTDEQHKIMNIFIDMKKNDGKIITFVPNLYSFWTLIKPIFMRGVKEKPFTHEKLKMFIKNTDQDVVESSGINVLPVKFSPEFLGKFVGMLNYAVSK